MNFLITTEKVIHGPFAEIEDHENGFLAGSMVWSDLHSIIEINEQLPQGYVSGNWKFDKGVFSELVAVKIPDKARSGEEKEAQFLLEVAQIKSGYSEDEIKSWDKQESEARAYLTDNLAETPLIDALIAETREDKLAFATNVIEKADSFSSAFGAALGRKRS